MTNWIFVYNINNNFWSQANFDLLLLCEKNLFLFYSVLSHVKSISIISISININSSLVFNAFFAFLSKATLVHPDVLFKKRIGFYFSTIKKNNSRRNPNKIIHSKHNNRKLTFNYLVSCLQLNSSESSKHGCCCIMIIILLLIIMILTCIYRFSLKWFTYICACRKYES